MVKLMEELVMGRSSKIMEGNGGVEIVELEYWTTLLALDREGWAIEQMQVIVDHIVFGFQPKEC